MPLPDRPDWEQAYYNSERHIKNLEKVMKESQKALQLVSDLSFEEDLAKYEDGYMTPTARDAIDQYKDMVDVCELALEKVNIAVGKDGD